MTEQRTKHEPTLLDEAINTLRAVAEWYGYPGESDYETDTRVADRCYREHNRRTPTPEQIDEWLRFQKDLLHARVAAVLDRADTETPE